MFAYLRSLYTQFFPAPVEPEKTTLEKVLALKFEELAPLHASITPAECDTCGLTNGMNPFEIAYRVMQLRAGEPVTGGFLAASLNAKR